MASWKADILGAIVQRDTEKVNSLLDSGNPKDYITVHYAESCLYCTSDLEGTIISSSQVNAGVVLMEIQAMVQTGHCFCTSNPPEADSGVIHGVNLLHLAAMYGPPTLVRRLLDDGYHANDVSLHSSSTPLHFLAQTHLPSSEALEIAEMLVRAGALVNVQDKRNNLPLHLALRCQSELALKLIDTSNCDAENVSGETPLLIAVKMANEVAVEKLVMSGANVNIKDRNEMLALNIAIHKDSLRMLTALLGSPHCDMSVVGVGRTGLRSMCPLVYATCRENEEAVELLLRKGAFVDCIDSEDSQPLLIAAYTDNITIARILINHGADVNLAPRQGYTPLHQASWEGHLEMCRLLLDSGAQHDTPTADKNTPLALACHGDHLDTIRLLLSRGCNVNNQDKDNDAPIHYCAYNRRFEGVKLLISHGADPDIENSFNVTPLWNAIFAGDEKSVELLIQCNVRLSVASRGIDQHAQTDHPTLIYDKPRTPLYMACANNRRKLIVMLLMAAVEFQEEPWFWGADFPPALRNEGPLLHWVTQQATQPRSLLRLCRNRLRRLLGVHPQRRVERLELPTVLRNYLLIKSFDRDLY